MGGATQSKLAFISTTIKKKNEDLSKSKNADEKTKVNGDAEPVMTDVDLNEEATNEPVKTVDENEKEEEKSDAQKTETDVQKGETEPDNSEAKVLADEAEKEKKVKTSHKVKNRIWSSFRFAKKKPQLVAEEKEAPTEAEEQDNKVAEATEAVPNNDYKPAERETKAEPVEPTSGEVAAAEGEAVAHGETVEAKPDEEEKNTKKTTKDKLMSSLSFLKKKSSPKKKVATTAEEAKNDEQEGETKEEDTEVKGEEAKPETEEQKTESEEKKDEGKPEKEEEEKPEKEAKCTEEKADSNDPEDKNEVATKVTETKAESMQEPESSTETGEKKEN